MKQIFFTLCVLTIFVTNGFSVEVPLDKVVHIKIPVGAFSVLEFPFKIVGTNSATFLPKYKIKKRGEKTEVDKLDIPVKTKSVGKKGQKSRRPRDIIIKRGENTLTIFPKKFGTLHLVVWGGKYPVLLKISVDEKDGDQYFKFIDYDENKLLAKKFEAVPHEKVIVKLIRYLFNNKTPKGYDNIVAPKEYDASGMHFTFVRTIRGKAYRGDEWVIQNVSDKTIKLYEEMFYADGIYAVAFEDDVLKPLEKARLFLVRKNREE